MDTETKDSVTPVSVENSENREADEEDARMKIGVLVSGGGTNLQALIDKVHGRDGDIVLVLSDKDQAYGLERARKADIPAQWVPDTDNAGNRLSNEDYSAEMVRRLKAAGVELVVLAGYMKIIPASFVQAFPDRIINIHPALIPSFCGAGYYGLHVHQAVIDYGAKLSGATVHFVNEEADAGPVIAQQAVAVLPEDTPETLQARILEQAEHNLLPAVTKAICQGRVHRKGRTVFIDKETETEQNIQSGFQETQGENR